MTSGASKRPRFGHHCHAVRSLLDLRDADAPAHVGPGGGRPLEQVVIELARMMP